MEDSHNKHLRQMVEEELQKAIISTKLVKDEGFRKPLEEHLEQLKELMVKNNRVKTSTLGQLMKLVQMGLRKSFYKLVLENCTDEKLIEIFGASTVERFKNQQSSESTGDCRGATISDYGIQRTDQKAEDSKQRLALKYPRKKLGTSANCSPYNVLHGSAEQSSNTLFKRRHEVFAPSPQPATYAEHKRMKRQLQEEAKNQTLSAAVKDVQITAKNDDVSKQFAYANQMTAQRTCMESAPSNDSPKPCNNNNIDATKSQPESTNQVLVLPEAANKTSNHQSENECSTDDCETSDKPNEQAIENVEQPKAVKANHKNKVNHRELHDLLSYTTEILPKLSRRKSVSAEEFHNAQLLNQFGITKELRIILQRADYGQIAQRTRSKSIDSMKYLENLEAAKQSMPVHNKIIQRRESKSVEMKKQSTTVTTTKAKVTKSTARKSVSKPQNTVQPITSSKHRNGIQMVNNVVKTKEKPILAKPKATSNKRTLHSPSPPAAKRTQTSTSVSTDVPAVESDERGIDDDSDEDEANVRLPNMVLNGTPLPNNDLNVHCHSDYMEKCCLCSYNGELMVRHYVFNHPKKPVYVSRVAPEQAQLIRADPFGISGKKAVSRYGDQEIIVFRCHFCDLRLSESQELWLDHISKHTGEYRYKCTLCPTFARLPIDRVKHHSVCTNPSMQLWHTYNFEANHLYAYMCNKCNFVQVLFVNMKRHLREDHPEAGSIGVECTKFSIVNFNLHDEDELPYGMVKLEPILDDTNGSIQENVEQKVASTLKNDTVQKQPEVVFIKQEIVTNDIEELETNTTSSIAKPALQSNGGVGVNFRADERQGSGHCFHSSKIRVKKLSDILAKPEHNSPNPIPRNTNPVNHVSSSNGYNNQPKCSTSNDGSTNTSGTTRVPLHANQHNSASCMVALQPWNGKVDADKKMLLKSKLTVPFLTAPYKCTVFNCGFYTNTSQTIGSHFQSHQKPSSRLSVGCDTSWLECSYCSYASLSIHNLLKHIDTVHGFCAYQCDRCCYRSRDPNSVRVHQRNYHSESDADAKILCILHLQKDYTSIDRDIIMNELKSNVKSLKCANCPMRNFNDLEHYRNHLKTHDKTYIECHVCGQFISANKMIAHISLHNIFMLQCVYCDYGINDTRTIKKHVADNHSDKLLCYYIRCSK
uniref:C2H2-type domain-containing protein n=1 Tax=Anopheles minimus TaxID=112268 RepID=A0A182WG41_9DIPT